MPEYKDIELCAIRSFEEYRIGESSSLCRYSKVNIAFRVDYILQIAVEAKEVNHNIKAKEVVP